MKISASLIVKNEQDHLRSCLESIKGVDEIVIVDTGSQDNTIAIAQEYTDKVYYGEEYLWQDDFAYSRNQSLDLCNGDWVLIIDADEVLEKGGLDRLKKIINETNKTGIYFNTINAGDHSQVHQSIRAFKRVSGRWVGKAHNYLVGLTTENANINLYYGYSNAHKLDPDRTLRILKKSCEENPNLTREKYYLAREYWYRKDYKTALYHYKEYVEKSSYLSEKSDAYLMMARCCWLIQRGDDARKYCFEAVKLNPDFKEALLFMAEIHYEPWKSKWAWIAKNATNKDVLFLRR
jgi:glycosyltransferase involved in cell wall biosynthesis